MKDPTTRARYTLTVLFAINLLNFFDRQLPSAIAEPLRKEWALSDAQIGWLATAFTLLYAVVGVPFGRLSDRRARPRLLSLGVAVWSVLTAASGVAWNYAALFVARLGVGVGEASCAPACSSLIGDLYRAKHRGRAISFFMLGLPVGSFLGNFIGGRLAAAHGWRFPFYVACIPGIILALLALTISEPARGAAETSLTAGRTHDGSPYWRVLRIPTMRWMIVSGALFNFNMYAIGTFLPAFLSRYHALHLKEANQVAAISFSLVGVPGLLLGGWIADHFGKSRPDGRLLVSCFAVFLEAPLIYLALQRQPGDLTGFVPVMGAGCLLGYFYYSGVYATIQDVTPPSLRGTAMALYFLIMYLIGGSFGPVITGRLSDHFAHTAMTAAGATTMAEPFRAAGLHSGMYAIPLCALAVSVVLFFAARTVTADMQEMHEWMAQPEGKPSLTVETSS